MRTILVSAVVAASLAPCAAGAVLNGSFELTALEIPSRVDINSTTSWSASSGASLLERGVNGVSQIAAQDGDQFVSMGHNGFSNDTLSQTITTTPGEVLDISFYVACIQGDAFQRITATAFDPVTNGSIAFVDAEVSSRSQGWVKYTFQFQPAGTSTRLQFQHTIGAISANIALDNVTVTPAPGAAGVLALAGIAAARRRRW